MNQAADDPLTCETKLVIVPGATYLFEEPGTLEQVASWILAYLQEVKQRGGEWKVC